MAKKPLQRTGKGKKWVNNEINYDLKGKKTERIKPC